MAFSSRFLATATLVVLAVGGAGLAVAADRVPARDNVARSTPPADLSSLAASADDLVAAGRATLGNLQGLDFDAMRAAIRRGDRAAATLTAASGTAGGATPVAGALEQSWQLIKARATTVAGLVEDLQRHDVLIFQATTAARDNDWHGALQAIDSGRKSLDDARAARAELGSDAMTGTLDELIARCADYDAALRSLYSYVQTDGSQSGPGFHELNAAVARAQSALPIQGTVYSVIVAETAGTFLGRAVGDLTQVRADINAELVAVSDVTP